MNTQKTISYYNSNAEAFIDGTKDVNFTALQDAFLRYIPEHGSILDFGCGSGRDTKYFLEKGFDVTATDGSERLCALASEYTGITVRCMMFEDLCEIGKYDGIWACASVLHLALPELRKVMKKMAAALKTGGVMYLSFKYGDFEGERDGRYFTDMTELHFAELKRTLPELKTEEENITLDVRPDREEKWLNILLRKTGS